MGIDERLVQKLSLRLAALLFVVVAGWSQAVLAQESPLRIAMSGSFQPFSTTDESGALTGFDADIARALARAMGRRVELVQIDWNGIQAGLQSGKYDLICGSMAITEARLDQMAFTLPYYVSGAQLFGTGSQPRTLGVTESSTYARFLLDHPNLLPETSVTAFGSEAEILAAISADKVEGFVSDRIVGGYYLSRSNAMAIQPVGDLLYVESCGIAARKSDGALIRQANAALFTLIQTGEYEAIYRKWVGEAPDIELLFEQWGSHAGTLLRDESSPPTTVASTVGAKTATAGPLLKGAWLTLQLSILTAVLSLATGTALGLACVSRNRWLQGAASVYVGLIRGTPLLVQLFLSYFVVATAVNRWVGHELMGPFASALLALVVNTTAYNGETLRGGILGVGKGQWDAARSLGMRHSRILARIILPQAFRSSLPSLGNNLVVLVKDTSLVGAITLIELTYAARNLVFQTGQAFTPFLTAGLFYLVIISALSWGVRVWERRLATP